VAAAPLFTAAAFAIYQTYAPSVNVVALQAARTAGNVRMLVPPDKGQLYITAIHWDYALIVGYAIGLLWACFLGTRVFTNRRSHDVAVAGVYLTVAGVLANIAQDLLMLAELPRPSAHSDTLATSIAALSFFKFSVLLAAAAVALGAWGTTFARLWSTGKRLSEPGVLTRDDVILPIPRDDPNEIEEAAEDLIAATDSQVGTVAPDAHWRRIQVPPDRKPGQPGAVGICVSGGGVRSASVALGALQAFQEAGALQEADYLVSVSGGGYMAGAFQLLVTDQAPEGRAVPWSQAYAPGSVEEDYLRRHSSYISDGPGQWAIALGVLGRNLLLSLILGALAVTVAGVAVGRFYHDTHIANLAEMTPWFVLPRHLGGVPTPPTGIAVVVAIAGALAAIAYIVSVAWYVSPADGTRIIDRGKIALNKHIATAVPWLAWLALLLVVVGVGAPAAIWVADWVTWNVGHATTHVVAVAAGLAGALGYIGTLAGVLWKHEKAITTEVAAGEKAARAVLPNSMIQMLLMWVCLLAVTALYALGAGWAASSGLPTSWWALLPIGLYAAAWLIDQTWMSLHPFYRQRLASAFALRRTTRNGRVAAKAYEPATFTALSPYAQRVDGDAADEMGGRPRKSPKLIFCATGNITGQDRTPPGRRAVSYTLADDYVGGPDVGWVKTSKLQALTGHHIRRDLTVEAAVAISGAAFASALGAQTRFYEVFLALANARLGAWLPNPYQVSLQVAACDDWTVPRTPRTRRLSYLYREILGLHPSTNPLLLCTDGGHYENLGLVELIRHRCETIYCIDATGDSPPSATTLAQAIALAYEETGTSIELEGELDLVPGAASTDGPFTGLRPRLSNALACTGTIAYPACKGRAYGRLIFAKTGLTADLPYDLLSYAVDNPVFPRDTTADQWFNVGQFDAYRQLGYEMGKRAFLLRERLR
jgi:hypothetical protein